MLLMSRGFVLAVLSVSVVAGDVFAGDAPVLTMRLRANDTDTEAVWKSPFMGLMQIHEDAQGRLRSVALLNLRISDQGPVTVFLRDFPPSCKGVVWNEMCRKPVSLQLTRSGKDATVTIPSIGAWNGGYLSLHGR